MNGVPCKLMINEYASPLVELGQVKHVAHRLAVAKVYAIYSTLDTAEPLV
mgnify:CR=1 FL=1|jgi:hypothetical protein